MSTKNRLGKTVVMMAAVMLMGSLGACGNTAEIVEVASSQVASIEETKSEAVAEASAEPVLESTMEYSVEPVQESSTKPIQEPPTESSAESVIEPATESVTEPATEPASEPVTNVETNGRLIVIDAGHQAKGNSDKEPIGPGATEMKAKVASGTKGCVSGLYEYELTLMVSEKLCEELEARGYEVLMVRTSHDVDISNAERAQVANEAGADAFIRIHANGSDNVDVSGVETLCQTASNPYNAAYYEDSRALSEQVLDGIINVTGAKKRRVVETDTMSGINWCQVPVTIVEMGFMTNEAEDSLMATEDYQTKLAQGMADGIDAYFVKK